MSHQATFYEADISHPNILTLAEEPSLKDGIIWRRYRRQHIVSVTVESTSGLALAIETTSGLAVFRPDPEISCEEFLDQALLVEQWLELEQTA